MAASPDSAEDGQLIAIKQSTDPRVTEAIRKIDEDHVIITIYKWSRAIVMCEHGIGFEVSRNGEMRPFRHPIVADIGGITIDADNNIRGVYPEWTIRGTLQQAKVCYDMTITDGQVGFHGSKLFDIYELGAYSVDVVMRIMETSIIIHFANGSQQSYDFGSQIISCISSKILLADGRLMGIPHYVQNQDIINPILLKTGCAGLISRKRAE